MATQPNRASIERGYISLHDVHEMLERIGNRMRQIDEPLAREYVIDPFPDGIERKIHQMCRRRQALFHKLAEDELQAEQERLASVKDDGC